MEIRKGVLTWWDMGQQTDPDVLRTGLDALGYQGLCLNQRTWSVSLKTALSCVDIKGTIVRKNKRDEKGRDGYSIVKEDKRVKINDYDTLVSAVVDPNGKVSVECGWNTVRESDLQAKVNHFRRVLPGGSVALVLVGLLEKLQAVTLKRTGGLYFVPHARLADWEAIAAVVERASCDESRNAVTVQSIEMGYGTLRDVRESIIAEVTASASQIEAELAEGFKDEAAAARRLISAAALREKTQYYESILGETLAVCHEAVKTAMMAYGLQASVVETPDEVSALF